jgi:hypothetical protein
VTDESGTTEVTGAPTEVTGAPTDLTGGMPATDSPTTGAWTAPRPLDERERRLLATIADALIPAAHGMPSAAEVLTDQRLAFVLRSRPDLAEPLTAALALELDDDVGARLDRLRTDAPTNLAALELVIVAGYYTDKRVRELIGYPGQMAIEVRSWLMPPYIEEGLIDAVVARGPVWRDPKTGTRAVVNGTPRTYAERFAGTVPAEGGHDGNDRT